MPVGGCTAEPPSAPHPELAGVAPSHSVQRPDHHTDLQTRLGGRGRSERAPTRHPTAAPPTSARRLPGAPPRPRAPPRASRSPPARPRLAELSCEGGRAGAEGASPNGHGRGRARSWGSEVSLFPRMKTKK
uniref:Uncharacterized protein n=1 Tax=Mustela putorius furo TaxID=9669 RepID=M3XRH4_MUSPF